MTELVTFGETSLRLSPDGGRRLEGADRLGVWADGAESSVAIAAGRLGTDALWASKLADTPLGRRAVAELREHGIGTEVAWTDESEARQGLTFFEGGRDPREATVLHDRGGAAAGTATPEELPMDAVQGAGAVFVDGSTLSLSETARETATAVLRAAGGRSVLGLDRRSVAAAEGITDVFSTVEVLVIGEAAAREVLGKPGEPPEQAHAIASEWEFETVVVARDERGALAWHGATIHEQEGIAAEAVDPSGQRAAFVGAFLGRLLADDGAGEALADGVAAAALTRAITGPIPTITPDEIERVRDARSSGGTSASGPRR